MKKRMPYEKPVLYDLQHDLAAAGFACGPGSRNNRDCNPTGTGASNTCVPGTQSGSCTTGTQANAANCYIGSGANARCTSGTGAPFGCTTGTST
jgi:hypothetical protein